MDNTGLEKYYRKFKEYELKDTEGNLKKFSFEYLETIDMPKIFRCLNVIEKVRPLLKKQEKNETENIDDTRLSEQIDSLNEEIESLALDLIRRMVDISFKEIDFKSKDRFVFDNYKVLRDILLEMNFIH